MNTPVGQVTERTFYPALINCVKERGGSGVQEVSFNSEPDILFRLLNRDWLLSVKIGETITTLKSGFIQYQRHKDESRLTHGMLLFLPDSVRRVAPGEEAVTHAVSNEPATCLVDTPGLKEEYRGLPFPQIVTKLLDDIGPRLDQRLEKSYPLRLVISLLQQHVSELMGTVSMADPLMLRVITDRSLLSSIGRLTSEETEVAARFFASYIVLSQILFLRLFVSAQPDVLSMNLRPITHHSLRAAFSRILEIDYRPIYEVDVLDSISEAYLRDTFDLIWGLEVERVRYELPGRIFHELMPAGIRKMLAAFYTRPQAADILAHLSIEKGNDTVFDPACGSGTILVSAYRRKLDLFRDKRIAGNPHKRFCESEIFGADIMPFAVHLTSANLASMDPGTTIDRTQVIQGDSLKLSRGRSYRHGVQIEMFPAAREAHKTTGELYEVGLEKVATVLMNPPFTKVERGVYRYVDMKRFRDICGGEVGLWGHFIALADDFLDDNGIYGAVLPINLLRGRESSKIRDFVFSRWTPLYILKPVFNYGFSEWSEYRDILFIARKGVPPPHHQVKFCLVKQDLSRLLQDDVNQIGGSVRSLGHLRSNDLDIQAFNIDEVRQHFMNLMWFCGVSDFRNRDVLLNFIGRFGKVLGRFPADHVREGYRSEGGHASFLFLTRRLTDARTEEAFLHFEREDADSVQAESKLGTVFPIERERLVPSLRTPIGVQTLDITHLWDYVAKQPYRELERVQLACGFRGKLAPAFWETHKRSLSMAQAHLIILRRINPYSPNANLVAFVSEKPVCPGDQLASMPDYDLDASRALCVLLNSCLFLSQFFLLKEESTGRFLHVRTYDLAEIYLHPKTKLIPKLLRVFHDFKQAAFPCLREQLDQNFDQRYKEFWMRQRSGQLSLFQNKATPQRLRLDLDMAVCKALGVKVTTEELTEVYDTIVKEMIITRGLRRD